jgi:hypothetical protein
VIDLRKSDGSHHRVVLGPEDCCDCQHMTYRGLVCRHLSCIRAALDWLAEAEQQEWLDGLDAGDPFAEVIAGMESNIAAMDKLIAELDHE